MSVQEQPRLAKLISGPTIVGAFTVAYVTNNGVIDVLKVLS